MKQVKNICFSSAWIFYLFFVFTAHAQVADNLAIDFDGQDDYISLNTGATPVSGDANFTVEAWFTIASPTIAPNPNAFRRLITLAGTTAPNSRFEVGEYNGALRLFWSNTTGGVIPGGVQTISGDLRPDCHHIAVVRNGTALLIYLDGNATPLYSGVLTGALNTNLFRIGHWGGGSTPGQDWLGTADEVRLWSVPRTVQQIQDFKDCSISVSGPIPDLVANWTFDQSPAVTPGGNNVGSMALDFSGNGNNGTFTMSTTIPFFPTGFLLNGPNSNFVGNTCPPRYQLTISDLISLFPVSLATICVGDKAHFCVNDNGGAVSVPPGGIVTWESSDGTSPFAPDPDLLGFPPANNALCFGVNKGVITNNQCNSVGPGYVDRKYRAKIKKTLTVGAQTLTCTYTSAEQLLRICCPPTGGTIQIVPSIPAPWCEGDVVTMTVFLNPADPWLAFGPNVTIDWCLVEGANVTPLPMFQNQLSFNNLQIVVGTDDVCLQAKISHCSCPGITVEKCVLVDPLPMCGTIDVVANPPAPIMPTPPAGSPYKYEICPGDYSTLNMVNPADFKNCTPVWQYHFDVPANDPWKDLGASNVVQNTNTLPQTDLNNPALWPPGATCIYYRIECRPESYPNSGCDPCYSNVVEVCLKPAPPSGVISGPTQFCEGTGTLLTITPNAPGNWTYCWYWNGMQEFISTSNTYFATKPGCYWVEIKNDCQATKVGPYCVEECAVVPIVKCPTDNPCACDGLPITLDGCDSYDTCIQLPLTFFWTASPSGNTGTGCTFTDVPDPNGTTYTLTVTNAIGCSKTSKPIFIKPCD